MRTTVFALLLTFTTSVLAEVLEVNIWNPEPGMAPLTNQYAQEARAIQSKLGANVTIGNDFDGRMHYAIGFDNWATWAAFGAKLQASKDWAAFIEKINKTPSAVLESNYLLNVATESGSGAGPMYQVFIWDPFPGQGNQNHQNALGARAIHEKQGVDVSINYDQLNNMHYVMSFDSLEAWAKFQDTPNPEFQEYMSNLGEPTAELIKVYTATTVP